MAGRRIAYFVLVLCVVVGIWVGAGGDARMRLFTAGLFGLCALSIAWKLWSSRGGSGGRSAGRHPPVPETGGAAPSGPWTVYGHDTFARADYFVAQFDTEAEARACARDRAQELAAFQDAALRDVIWVEPPDSRFRMRG